MEMRPSGRSRIWCLLNRERSLTRAPQMIIKKIVAWMTPERRPWIRMASSSVISLACDASSSEIRRSKILYESWMCEPLMGLSIRLAILRIALRYVLAEVGLMPCNVMSMTKIRTYRWRSLSSQHPFNSANASKSCMILASETPLGVISSRHRVVTTEVAIGVRRIRKVRPAPTSRGLLGGGRPYLLRDGVPVIPKPGIVSREPGRGMSRLRMVLETIGLLGPTVVAGGGRAGTADTLGGATTPTGVEIGG